MLVHVYTILILTLVFTLQFDILRCYDKHIDDDDNFGPGEALHLTPLIETGRIDEARKSASVKPFVDGLESYAGYLTVDKAYNSNLFFWFFKADDRDWENMPVTVWLEGGPGGPTLFSIFLLNGPFEFKDKKLQKRFYSWHKASNMIYIDNPVGTGFSYTNDDGYTKNQTIISKHLYKAITQFFVLFPNLKGNDFYLAGESYAGKYIPSFAYNIYKNNRQVEQHHGPATINDKVYINLKGLFIGNGLVDPINMLNYGDYLYQLGLIDTNTWKRFKDLENQIKRAIRKSNWDKATELVGKMILGSIFYPEGSLYENVTGLQEYYNYINLTPPDLTPEILAFINSAQFRRSVHVGDKTFNDGEKVAIALKQDILKSVVKLVEELLDHYRIMFYNGQLDIIVAYPLTINFIKKMKWSSAYEYATAERHIWRVNSDIAGYYKTAGNLSEVLVRNAGHMVTSDQPQWSYILFSKFIANKNLNGN